MRKRIIIFVALTLSVIDTMAATSNYVPKKFNTVTSYNDVYPYVLNNTKTNINAKNISTNNTSRRSVVSRSNKARAVSSANATVTNRRVVQRPGNTVRSSANITPMRTNNNQNSNVRVSSSVRARSANNVRSTTTTTVQTQNVSAQRCFADYKECMESYCKREDTAYNRCYCSAKLAQIDSRYQNTIENLIQQIVRLQYGSSATSDEIKEYWDQTVGVYTHDNPWVNIDNALNIEWADTQSRIRGQNAFNTGHQYCVQHLHACSYMASNLRDAYKSEISRDCETYEKSLQRIQSAAESVIESYND